MEQYAFTGDLKTLKHIGYKFQKLYASNYKSYTKDKLIMYVISKMVLEVSNLDFEFQTKMIGFILKNKDKPRSFWAEDRVVDTNPPMAYNGAPTLIMTILGNIVSQKEFNIGRIAYMDQVTKHFKKEEQSGEDKEGYDKIEDGEFAREPFRIRIDFVEQILELNNLHPLKIIKVEVE